MMFDEKSRYVELELYHVTDSRGRTVAVVPVPEQPDQVFLGTYILRQGQRLDHLAARYLNNQAGFWRICELNDVMLPEALTETRKIDIPRKRR